MYEQDEIGPGPGGGEGGEGSPVNNRDNRKRSLISRGIHGEGHPFVLDLTGGPRPLFHFKNIHLSPPLLSSHQQLSVSTKQRH